MILLSVVVFLGLLAASAPSLVSHSPLGRSLLAQTMAGYGWTADADSVQVGWLTPARVTGLQLHGNRAGSKIHVGELQTTITLPQLFSGDLSRGRFGEIVLRDVHVACSVAASASSLETDLTDFLLPSDEPSTVAPEGTLQVQGLQIDVTDAVTTATWSLKQSNASLQIDPVELQSQWQGVLSQPGGSEGSVQGQATVGMMATDSLPVSLQIQAESLPLSLLSLVARRFPESELPAEITGDLSGNANIAMPASGILSVSLSKVELRGFAAYDPQTHERLWSNELTQLNGDWIWQPGRIIAKQVSAKTDFATVSMNGAFADSISVSGSESNPLAWLDQVDATADILIDLPRLQAAMPSVLPLRTGSSLHRGTIRATIEPMTSNQPRDSRDSQRRRRLVVHSDLIEATADGKPVQIAAMNATAIVASDATQLSAEQFELNSPFARVQGHGDIASGAAEANVDFGKLARMLQPIFEFDQQNMQGDVRVTLRWDAEPSGLWRLRGNSQIDNLAIELAPEQRLQQRQLISTLDIEGRWSSSQRGWSLDELSKGFLSVQGDGMRADAELVQTVPNPDQNMLLPLRLRGQGRIESIAEILRPWMPESLRDVSGGLDFSARASVSAAGELLVQAMDGQISSLKIPSSESEFQQELVKLHFDGKAHWPRQEVSIRTMTLTGDAVSAAVQGEWINNMVDFEIAWRADLDRLQTSATKRVAREPQQRELSSNNRSIADGNGAFQTVGFNRNTPPVAAEDAWIVAGQLEGNTVIIGELAKLQVDTKISGRNVSLSEPLSGSNPPKTSVVWAEPAVELEGKLKCNFSTMAIESESIQLSTDWCGATLTGAVSWQNDAIDLQLRGPARFKMDEVARRLSTLSGMTIVAEGLHQTPLEILYAQNNREQYAFTIKGNLGWETIDTAGMLFGPAEVPFRMTESVVTIQPSRIPVLGPSRLTPRMIGPQVPPLGDQPRPSSPGEITLAGDVHYRPELYIELKPGTIARGVELTPDMTGMWLKYLAPIAADAARVEGTFSADLQQAVVWIDQPRRTEIRGRLDIERVQMNAGPLADQVIASARQLQALAAIGSAPQPPRTGRTLIALPAQSVEFSVAGGAVNHRALMFDVDRARVVTSGQVDFDGRLDLIAQIPLDAKWLGSDLRSLSGQTMTLPIDGTLSRPSLDSAGVRRVIADFGVQAAQKAAQEAAGNYLQQQLGRGQQQLEQGLNKGLEKLRIDKLFGN
jgi:hypothetical protein